MSPYPLQQSKYKCIVPVGGWAAHRRKASHRECGYQPSNNPIVTVYTILYHPTNVRGTYHYGANNWDPDLYSVIDWDTYCMVYPRKASGKLTASIILKWHTMSSRSWDNTSNLIYRQLTGAPSARTRRKNNHTYAPISTFFKQSMETWPSEDPHGQRGMQEDTGANRILHSNQTFMANAPISICRYCTGFHLAWASSLQWPPYYWLETLPDGGNTYR